MASSSTITFSRGRVHELTGGFMELQEALARSVSESSSGAGETVSDVVIVEFSARWCGPCKRIRPLFDELAMIHDDVLFVYVDAEGSESNKELTVEIGVRGFPTFVVYKGGSRTDQFSGADARRLRETAEKHSTRGSGAGGAGSSSGSADLIPRVQSALMALRNQTSFTEFTDGARAAQTFCSNVVRHPHEDKYRRVKLKAAAFHRRLGRFQAGHELMIALGFERQTEGDEEMYVMSRVDPSLPRVATLLEQALASSQQAGGSRTPSAQEIARARLVQSAIASRTNPLLAQQLAVVCAQMLATMKPPTDVARRSQEAAAPLLSAMLAGSNSSLTNSQPDDGADDEEEEEPPPSFEYAGDE